MTVTTFHPDAHVESTSVDGRVREDTDAVWATIRGDGGDNAADSIATMDVDILFASGSNWNLFSRIIIVFDVSILGEDAIDSATQEFVIKSGGFVNNFSDSVSLVLSSPASDTALVDGDYDSLGTTKQATDLALSGLTADSAAFSVFTLNSTGRGNLSGIFKLGMRATRDLADSEPVSPGDGERTLLTVATAEEDLAGDRRPKLVVTHTTEVSIQWMQPFGASQPYPSIEFAGAPWAPSYFFQMEPSDQVNPVYYEAWQNQSATLTPIYPSQYVYGDISNMPYFLLQLTVGIHFDPDASGVFQGPATFDILEGSADFELRVPL